MFVGAGIMSFGYSLVYPGFGVKAVRLAPRGAKGLAMGAFTAFLDLSLGIASPSLGWLMKARMDVEGVVLTDTLDDGEVAREFAAFLPLCLTLEDYASAE